MPYFRIKLLTVLLGLIHILPSLFLDLRRYAVEGFGNTFGDATDGVTISAEPRVVKSPRSDIQKAS